MFSKKLKRSIEPKDIWLGKIYDKAYFEKTFKSKNDVNNFLIKYYGDKVFEMRKEHNKKIAGTEIVQTYYKHFNRTPLLLIVTKSDKDKIIIFFIDVSSHDNLHKDMFHYMEVDSIEEDISKIDYIVQSFSSSSVSGVDMITDIEVEDFFIDMYNIKTLTSQEVKSFSRKLTFFETSQSKISRFLKHSIILISPILIVMFLYSSFLSGLTTRQKQERDELIKKKEELTAQQRKLSRLDIYTMEQKKVTDKVVK